MTRRTRIAAGVAALLLLGRSYWLPSRAPTWLRGASPFTWSETRAERGRCRAWAEMVAVPFTHAHFGEDFLAPSVVHIDRTLRTVRDSLAFEGRITHERYVNYVFHCATAYERGHPGEHHSSLSEPWGSMDEWPAVYAFEQRVTRLCQDSAVRYFPTSRFSSRTLMLRSISGGGRLLMTAIDTVYEREPQTVACQVGINGRDSLMYTVVEDPRFMRLGRDP